MLDGFLGNQGINWRVAQLSALRLAEIIGVECLVGPILEGSQDFSVVLVRHLSGAAANPIPKGLNRSCVGLGHVAVLSTGQMFGCASEWMLAKVHSMFIALEDVKVADSRRILNYDVFVRCRFLWRPIHFLE